MYVIESGCNEWQCRNCYSYHPISYSLTGRIFGEVCPVCGKHQVMSQLPTVWFEYNGNKIVIYCNENSGKEFSIRIEQDNDFYFLPNSCSIKSAKISALKYLAENYADNVEFTPRSNRWRKYPVKSCLQDYRDYLGNIDFAKLGIIRASAIIYKGTLYVGECHDSISKFFGPDVYEWGRHFNCQVDLATDVVESVY